MVLHCCYAFRLPEQAPAGKVALVMTSIEDFSGKRLCCKLLPECEQCPRIVTFC